MEILELHFNPNKEDKSFDSFIFEPENIYEKKLGNLYLVGEINNATPSSSKLLKNLAKEIKNSFYKLSSKSPEKSLSQSLKKANSFLSEEVKKDNVNWLGNLNFAVLSVKNQKLNFTQTGDLKILLVRRGEMTDISRELELQKMEPYPLKIFFNTVSGKLASKDLILVLTKEVYGFFEEEGIFKKICRLENPSTKEVKKTIPGNLFNQGKESHVSGICFVAFLEEKKSSSGKKVYQTEKKISFSSIFRPVIRPLRKTKKIFPKNLLLKKEKFSFFSNIASSLKVLQKAVRTFKIRRNVIIILLLALVLILGFLIFQRSQRENNPDLNLEKSEEKIVQAENFLLFQEKEKAENLLRETWNDLSGKEGAEPLRIKAEGLLKEINNFQEIENPRKADPEQFSKKINPPSPEFTSPVSYLSYNYFLNKETCQILKENTQTSEEWMEDKGPCSKPKSMAVDGSIWVINEDSSILRYHQGAFQGKIVIDIFPFVNSIEKIETKAGFPYLLLLDSKGKRIIITDKKGEVKKQIFCQKFDNLKDFKLSEDSKKMLLLNGSEAYQIEI